MGFPRRSAYLRWLAAGAIAGWFLTVSLRAEEVASTPAIEIMPIDDVRPGMTGVGKTVLEGTKLETFEAKVLGVLRGVEPGRDMVLCRLSGAGLDYTGVIAGMSGSPIYIEGKLLGAVAYTWPFNKEPIAGVTPFDQMRSFSEQPLPVQGGIEAAADGSLPVETLVLNGASLPAADEAVAAAATPVTTDGGTMTAIRMPLAASGFGPKTLALIREQFAPLGMLAIAGGGAGGGDAGDIDVKPEAPGVCGDRIVPGAPLGLSLVVGDFDLSALGTTTHVEGDRVWGWGHPFMGRGKCQYVLRSSHIHLVNPKQDLSAKIGSPRAVLGVVDADCSTCIAGTLGAELDLLPVRIVLRQGSDGPEHVYEVKIVRHPSLIGPLVSTVLTGALEAGGALDSEITLHLHGTIQAEGLDDLCFDNTYSGGSDAGTQGAQRLLAQVATVADTLTRNPFSPTRIESIDCRLDVVSRRTSAAISHIALNSDRYEPGETLKATVTLRPFRCEPIELTLEQTLPDSMPPGTYTAHVCDAPVHLKQTFTEEPNWLAPRSVQEIADVFRLQLDEQRKTLYLRIVSPESGLAIGDVELPQLPASVQSAFVSRRASPARTLRNAMITRLPTDWVIEGSSEIRFTVVRDKQVFSPQTGATATSTP